MGAADDLLGTILKGQRRGESWKVIEKIGATKGQSQGAFSVVYKCQNDEGLVAFLKASDLSKVIGAANNDIVQNLLNATTAYNFERQVLEHCKGNAMDRVVTAIDFGSQQATSAGMIDVVFFLIFELAEGDLRQRVEKRNTVDLLWIVSSMHDFAVAVSQMHSGSIYHNDLKPANALVFNDNGNKIADLGRATTPLINVSHEDEQCAGDRRYAPPEQLYRNDRQRSSYDKFQLFRAGDLYNLGNLAYYLITGRGITIEIVSRMRDELRPAFFGGGWTDTFDDVLPHWQSAFGDVIKEAYEVVPENWSDYLKFEFKKVLEVIASLCEPDVDKRGHFSQIGKPNQFDLQRYISALDLQRKKLVVHSSNAN